MSVQADTTREPDIALKNGWSLYHWNGLSRKWVLCAPDGRKAAMTDEYDIAEVEAAKRWAYRTIRDLKKEATT